MPYIEGRVVHDADAHIMELPGFCDAYLEARYRPALDAAGIFARRPGFWERLPDTASPDPQRRAEDERDILVRKNWDALGAYRREDRPAALDYLGVASQLVFTTALLTHFPVVEHGDDLDLTYALAHAHNRHVVDFCSIDERLLATGYVPLADFERAQHTAREAVALGCKALLVPSRCPKWHSPSHIGFDPVWTHAQDAGVPIVFHVGGGGPLLSPAYFNNGLPPVPDFHGGDDNFTSIDYLAIAYPPMQTLATLIIDRVLDRFPRLKFGVIEQGASWVPGWMRAMDSAHDAFSKNEERLRALSLRPSEFVRRQVRVTPYPHEDAGWIVANSGDEVCMFSSDFPHVEGGRNPMKRFENSLAGASPETKRRFYCDNFEDMMGDALPSRLRRSARSAAAR